MRETSRGRKREYLRVQTETRLFLRKHEEKRGDCAVISKQEALVT